ncbi:hypothetical protein BKP35_08180 [Anaerobacillus arseniciselenatis]|uniref:Uncharacterized protein n=1 Tax=Anaerobacillus arseniciselenatis TaxID=85682 RepID=A0A1S2LNR3_9BACI|nr:YppG family protein [Anaerobacillus arseniciselenatis]OIJ14162.1 hypothetical protein BKP35_08180 [Anaerobacillus arseniciselenatis]
MFPFKSMMFPFSMMKSNNTMGFNPFEFHNHMMKHHPMMKQLPMMMNQNPMRKQNPAMMKNSPSGIFNSFPFNYDQQQYQEENPFLNSFFQPQSPTQGQNQQQQAGQIQQSAFPFQGHSQQQPFSLQGQTQVQNRSQFPQSLFTDQNGKVDLNKIGGGVQTALNLANQVSPIMKMFGGFFR